MARGLRPKERAFVSERGWRRVSSLWGYRDAWAKCHHEWRRVSSKSHSWCHLVQEILHPQRREPLPQPHSQVHSPHWVEILVPCHQFRDSSHPRCQLNRWDPGDQVMFHFVYPPSSQTRSQVNFLSWTPFGDPSAHFFYPVIVHPKAVACPNY